MATRGGAEARRRPGAEGWAKKSGRGEATVPRFGPARSGGPLTARGPQERGETAERVIQGDISHTRRVRPVPKALRDNGQNRLAGPIPVAMGRPHTSRSECVGPSDSVSTARRTFRWFGWIDCE